MYEAAAKALKETGITKRPNLYALKTEYKTLDAAGLRGSSRLTSPRWAAFFRRYMRISFSMHREA